MQNGYFHFVDCQDTQVFEVRQNFFLLLSAICSGIRWGAQRTYRVPIERLEVEVLVCDAHVSWIGDQWRHHLGLAFHMRLFGDTLEATENARHEETGRHCWLPRNIEHYPKPNWTNVHPLGKPCAISSEC